MAGEIDLSRLRDPALHPIAEKVDAGERLDARGVVREDEDAGRIRYRLEDPFLATWIVEAQRV